jgi:hypothetical protein
LALTPAARVRLEAGETLVPVRRNFVGLFAGEPDFGQTNAKARKG